MFLFIATIFIAELIIALTLITYILKADKAVQDLRKEIIFRKPQIKAVLLGVREGIHIVREKQGLLFEIVKQKRNQYLISLAKMILVYLLLFIIKGKCKKAASICQGILLVKDVWDSVSA